MFLFQRISNIADMANYGVNLIQAISEKHPFLEPNELRAYLLEPKRIQACEHQNINNYSLGTTCKINYFQQEQKLNSEENIDLITF